MQIKPYKYGYNERLNYERFFKCVFKRYFLCICLWIYYSLIAKKLLICSLFCSDRNALTTEFNIES